jgi:hypothetical protein
VALKTPPSASLVLPLALTAVLAACGGGTTGAPATPTASSGTASATVAQQSTATPPAAADGAQRRATTTHPSASRTTAQAPTATGAAASPAHGQPAARPQAGGAPQPAASSAPTAPSPRRGTAKAAPRPAGSPLDELAVLTLTRRASPTHYFQQGTVTGTYDGTIVLEASVTSKGVLVRFTATLSGGTLVGRGVVVAVIHGLATPGLRGTAAIVGGTGRFAGLHGPALTVTGRAKADASHARVRLAGTVWR